jgi:hypothetical protein
MPAGPVSIRWTPAAYRPASVAAGNAAISPYARADLTSPYNDATFRWTPAPASGPPGRHPVRSQNSAQPAPPGRPGPSAFAAGTWLDQVADGDDGPPGAASFAGFQVCSGCFRGLARSVLGLFLFVGQFVSGLV